MLARLKTTLKEIQQKRSADLTKLIHAQSIVDSSINGPTSSEDLKNCFPEISFTRLETDKPLQTRSGKQVMLEYPKEPAKIESLQSYTKKIEALLTLELPFKIDPLSIAKSRGEVYNKTTLIKNSLKKLGTTGVREIIEMWLNENNNPHTQRTCSAFEDDVLWPVLRRYYIENETHILLSAEEIFKDSPLRIMLDFIDRLARPPSIKDSYRSYAKNFWKFLQKHLPKFPPTLSARKKDYLNLFEAKKFFDALEQRALKTTVIGKFEDLLLCRALLYIPLMTNELFALETIDKTLMPEYPLPESFISLRNAFGSLESFLPKKFTDDALYTKVNRLGVYTQLHKPLNPSVLRRTLSAICRNDLLINSEVMKALPSR